MRKKQIAKEHSMKTSPRTIEERLESIETQLGKTTRWTVIVAVVGALLGTGGLAGLYSINSQVAINQAQARQSGAEAASKELEIISLNHAKTIESLRKIIEQMSANNQLAAVEEVRKILLQTELDFQERLMHQRNPNIEEEAARIKELQIRCINRLDELRETAKNNQSGKAPK
jgi:hypothetical protein